MLHASLDMGLRGIEAGFHTGYPQERPILPGDVRAQAEQDAWELRQWLGLEVIDDRQNGWRDAELLAKLVDDGLVEIVHLSEAAETTFGGLVIGPAIETLDDGEAATIAYASEHGGMPLIDERKASRICEQRFAELRLASTVDVLAHASVQNVLGRHELANAVFNALRQARMGVLPHHGDWVTSLIGPERTSLCGSLPRSLRLLQASS